LLTFFDRRRSGIVRSPILTTVMQVASRLVLVWGIVYPFPYLALTPFYSSMLIAWSVTEVIRYSYFTLSLSGHQFSGLTWLRYSGFFVLYPIGITSECALIYLATGPAEDLNPLYKWVLYAILAIYVPGKKRKGPLLPLKTVISKVFCTSRLISDLPGAYTLYSYMMTQRRKVMKAKDAKATQ
jgi:very-long-chain (3R)-3-hydroxyacyl-CoA dehydratase